MRERYKRERKSEEDGGGEKREGMEEKGKKG